MGRTAPRVGERISCQSPLFDSIWQVTAHFAGQFFQTEIELQIGPSSKPVAFTWLTEQRGYSTDLGLSRSDRGNDP